MNRILSMTMLALALLGLTACNPQTEPKADGGNPDIAANVNGKPIKMEEVEKIIKAQLKGQNYTPSPLELAQARLQVLNQLIQQEVMYQRAEREKTLPADDEINKVINEQKTGGTAEDFAKKLQEAGETEEGLRELVKKQLAINKLIEKITSAVTPPTDKEVEEFYNNSKDQFINKRGAALAVIIIDPADGGPNDTTKNDIEARKKAQDIFNQLRSGADFAEVARNQSEDPNTNYRGGDWRAFSEDELKQTLNPQVADYIMTKMQAGGIVPGIIPLEGKYLIIKLVRKQEKDEPQTLESPGIRGQITEFLTNARKQLLSQAYVATVMDEAKIDNILAKNVVANPNSLSGARPAPPPNSNANANANANANVNANAGNSANKNAKANVNTANAAVNTTANAANTTNVNTANTANTAGNANANN